MADDILHINRNDTNSRLWVYAVPVEGEPIGIINTVEPGILDKLPGQKRMYFGREELLILLKTLGGKRWGVHISDTLTMVSYLDQGIAVVLENAGLELASAAGLVQRFKGLLDGEGIASHERAAAALYDVVEQTWETARKAYMDKTSLSEGDLLRVMTAAIEHRGLITDHAPIIGAGANAGNPHYSCTGAGDPIREGSVVQFDLWAKERDPGAIYADISWVGVFAPAPSAEYEKAFRELVSVREGVYEYIAGEIAAGRTISGAMADAKARKALVSLGYGAALKHRTGHGIDTQCHGSGVNIDSWEFPDPRPILEGSCFSLEPGIYFPDFGMRTEVNVYIRDGRAIISQGDRRQFTLLNCKPETTR
ncbi:M24 family metallopeptidase [Treponema primitia]|uniref:M24 family metallopeptidase n=1 Tax=Treponema primitia TaxID=88058 RepID=UPI0002E34ADA|nr:M24 family metallopeptidase [Treponema primitia]